jgi:hypothetical protein
MSDEDPDDTDRTEASAERIAQLEQQVERLQEQVDTLTPDVSRRQALQGGAAVGLGALLGGGATLGATRSARAAPDADDVGTPSDHVDVYAQNVYDTNGTQYDQFSEADFREDANSPFTSVSVDQQLSFADGASDGGQTVVVATINAQFAGDNPAFQINGLSSGEYHYGSVRDGWTPDANLARFAVGNAADRTIVISFGRNRSFTNGTKLPFRAGMWSGYVDVPAEDAPQSITIKQLNGIRRVRVFHRPP